MMLTCGWSHTQPCRIKPDGRQRMDCHTGTDFFLERVTASAPQSCHRTETSEDPVCETKAYFIRTCHSLSLSWFCDPRNASGELEVNINSDSRRASHWGVALWSVKDRAGCELRAKLFSVLAGVGLSPRVFLCLFVLLIRYSMSFCRNPRRERSLCGTSLHKLSSETT